MATEPTYGYVIADYLEPLGGGRYRDPRTGLVFRATATGLVVDTGAAPAAPAPVPAPAAPAPAASVAAPVSGAIGTTGTSGQGWMVTEAQLQIAALAQQDKQFTAEQARLAQQHADQMALAREQLAAEERQSQAEIAARRDLTAMEIAARREEGEANRALQRWLFEQEKQLRTMGMALEAATASGYIPQALADQLGIQAGPTLEAQQVAWARFMDAMNLAANPRNLPAYFYLQQGIQPPAGVQTGEAPVPFIQALATDQGLPVSNIGANMGAISQAAREFTAQQLAAMPPLFQEESLNPQALASIGGTSQQTQFALGNLGALSGQQGQPSLSFLGSLNLPQLTSQQPGQSVGHSLLSQLIPTLQFGGM